MKRAYLVLGLLIMIMAGLMPACGEDEDRVVANVREASLVDVWDSVAKETGIEGTTARLCQLSLWLTEDGTVRMLYCMFYASDADGKAGFYFVNSEHDGDVTCYSSEGQSQGPFWEVTPLSLFEELDGVPVADKLRGEESVHISAGGVTTRPTLYESGSLYGLYHLRRGELVPLKEVSIGGDVWWSCLSVSRYDGATPGSAEFWFLTTDLDKAESAAYA